MAIAINKGKVPKDYAVCIMDKIFDYSIPPSGTLNSDITAYTNASKMSSIPPYYMVGELALGRSYSLESTSSTSNFGWDVTIDNAIMNKFRFIRFVVTPMIIYEAPEQSGDGPAAFSYSVYFTFSVIVNGSTYTHVKLVQSNIKPGVDCAIPSCAFIFDTKTKSISEDTSDLSELWSSI